MKNNSLHTFVILAYEKSPHLRNCIESIKNQTYPSNIILATTTPNSFISNLAQKYQLHLASSKHINIGSDFDFALHQANTPLVTIAHQDDVYSQNYSREIIKAYQKYPDSSIIFTDYYEIRNHQKVYSNTNLKIKRLLLTPIRSKKHLKSVHFKRSLIRFGNPISCPTVTFVIKNCPSKIFTSNFKSNCDWHAWENLRSLSACLAS